MQISRSWSAAFYSYIYHTMQYPLDSPLVYSQKQTSDLAKRRRSIPCYPHTVKTRFAHLSRKGSKIELGIKQHIRNEECGHMTRARRLLDPNESRSARITFHVAL